MNHAISTRRDTRHDLRSGSSIVEFTTPLSSTEGTTATLNRISVAGLAFEISAHPLFDVGETLKGVTVRVGDCRLKGDLVVQGLSSMEPPRVEVGCLFYPETPGDADRLMALIAGIEAARSRA